MLTFRVLTAFGLCCLVASLGIMATSCGWSCNVNVVGSPLPMPERAPCVGFESYIRSVDAEFEIPSLTPAPVGVRIIVDPTFDPFMGSSAPVPGGRMVWSVWIYHWLDGDKLGAIGRLPDPVGADVIGGQCRWYDPL